MIKGALIYLNIAGVKGVLLSIIGLVTRKQTIIKKYNKFISTPIELRVPSSDITVYKQIFIYNEYRFKNVRDINTIIDAGANIGLASIYFANKFPNAKILAIEPDTNNYELLLRNISQYPNITPIKGALWDKDEEITLVDSGLGEFGYMTEKFKTDSKLKTTKRSMVQGMTINYLLQKYNLDTIDILKVDIEGSEKELFSNSNSWINHIDSLIVELHERFKSGCNRSFYNGTPGFTNEWVRGENIYLSRDNCIKP